MKKNEVYKKAIGLSHEEAAIFLGVSCGRWSMFVSGKRGLPPQALEKLKTLLAYLENKEEISATLQEWEMMEKEQTQQQLSRDYKAIQLKLHLVNKKLLTVEKIRVECFAALKSVDFLKQTAKHPPFLADGIELFNKQRLKKYSLYQLTALQLKKENLEVAKVSFEKKMKVYNRES